MAAHTELSSVPEILPFRERYRREMSCQVVHDSIHRRAGWMLIYRLALDGAAAGYGAAAVGGPWKEKPTLLEFYVVPECRGRAFELFEALLAVSGARLIEMQSNDALFAVMLHTYATQIASEKIVFHDRLATSLTGSGALLRRITPPEEVQACIDERQGGIECVLELDGQVVGQGGVLFHYNRPYGDIYMEVAEPSRRRGLGSFLVQELKRVAYELGAVPCARCSPANIASRRTLQKAGFVPFAHMLTGVISQP